MMWPMYQLYVYLEYSLVNSGTFHSTFTLTKGVVHFISMPSHVPIPDAMLIYEVQIMSTYTSESYFCALITSTI